MTNKEYTKAYAILYNEHNVDDFDESGYGVAYLSLNKEKRDEVFERLRQNEMHPAFDPPFMRDFEPDEDEPEQFSYFWGKWSYTYKTAEYDLDNESKLH